ncbi:transposase, partial [Lactobacillus reuteri]|nr:transposase [Limosilactobacillus reuteri]
MNNSIKTILGIKDPYLKLDEKNFDNPIKDQPNQIIVHLIQ